MESISKEDSMQHSITENKSRASLSLAHSLYDSSSEAVAVVVVARRVCLSEMRVNQISNLQLLDPLKVLPKGSYLSCIKLANLRR